MDPPARNDDLLSTIRDQREFFLIFSENSFAQYNYGNFNLRISDKDAIKIHIKNTPLFHGDLPDDWSNFLKMLSRFVNLEEIILENCKQIYYAGWLFSFGLSCGQLDSKQLCDLLKVLKNLPKLKVINIIGTFEYNKTTQKIIQDNFSDRNAPDINFTSP
jgi:hypothetical protein